MKRAIAWTLGTVLLLILLLLAAAGWLLGSDSGTRTLLRQLDAMAPGLMIGSSEGDLLGRLELKQLKLEWESGLIEIERLLLDWSPLRLLERELLLDELSASGLDYSGREVDVEVEQAPAEPLQWPIELPNLKLPLDIVIRKLAVDDVSLLTAPDAEPIRIDSAALVARWDSTGITIDNLEASGPDYEAAISGQVNPTGDYVLNIDNQLRMMLAGDKQFDLKGSIVGNRHSLQLEQILSGAARAGLSLNLRRPLVEPAWTGQIRLVELPSSLLGMSAPVTIEGSLVNSGNWPRTQLSGKLETTSEIAQYHQIQMLIEGEADLQELSARLEKLDLLRHESPMRLSLQGEMAADGTLNATGDWRDLQWPLLGAAAFSSSEGKLAVDGSLDDYRFTAGVQVAMPGIPDGQWQLAGTGDQQGVELQALKGQLLQGTVEAEGTFAWAPPTRWSLSARGAGLQANSLVPELDTSLGFTATSEGLIDDSGSSLQLVLENIAGTLNDQPVTGSGEINHDGAQTDVRRVQIAVGSASAQASGILGTNSNLQWSLQVPTVRDLLPAAGGSLTSRGKLTGPVSAPTIRATLKADGFNYDGLDISRLATDINLDLRDKNPSSVTLDGSELVIAEQPIEALQLKLTGYVREHDIRLAVSQPEDAEAAAELLLVAEGGYADALWSGTLQQLTLEAKPFGDWRLQKPFALTASAASAGAKPFCLRQREGASLCATGDWRAEGKTSAEFELSNLSLAQFAEYLPDTISQVSGELWAEGRLQQQGNIDAWIKTRVSAGELVVQDTVGELLRLNHQGAELEVSTRDKGVQGWIRSQVGTTRLDANVRLPDLLAVADKNGARLEGKLQLSVPDLELIPSLVPAVTAIKGTANVDFEVAGQLGEPLLRGRSIVDVSRLEVEQLGWNIGEAIVNIGADGTSLLFDGNIVSGGRLGIDGRLGLSAQQSWPLDLTLAGKDFALTDLPNLQVFISPDLKIQHGADGFSLTGTIAVPRADITIRDLPAGAITPSRDVVVKRDGGTVREVESTALVATDIAVSLSDEVSVSALGFDGYIEGKLRLKGKPSRPLLATGDVRVKEGTFRAYGQRLEIERGMLSYANSPIDNPGINIRAIRQINDVQVGVDALGTARRITVKTFSSPSMSENDRISYLVAGKPAREGASLSLEREIAKDLTVGVRVDTKTGESAFITRYRILRTMYAEVGSSARSSSLDLFYTLETE